MGPGDTSRGALMHQWAGTGVFFMVPLLRNPFEEAIRNLEWVETLILETDLVFPILLPLKSLMGSPPSLQISPLTSISHLSFLY